MTPNLALFLMYMFHALHSQILVRAREDCSVEIDRQRVVFTAFFCGVSGNAF
jgi:hypothetical protein